MYKIHCNIHSFNIYSVSVSSSLFYWHIFQKVLHHLIGRHDVFQCGFVIKLFSPNLGFLKLVLKLSNNNKKAYMLNMNNRGFYKFKAVVVVNICIP